MKYLLGLFLIGALAATGCNKGNPGGPGADPNKNKGTTTPTTANTNTNTTDRDNTFTLDVPNLSTSLNQGESKNITIGINRGNKFAQDVTLKFDNLPKGITIEPSSPKVKASENEAKLTVKAAADAAVGNHTVRVIGHPQTGADATNEFKVSVDQK